MIPTDSPPSENPDKQAVQLSGTASARGFGPATRPAVSPTSTTAFEEWQPGDVVLDNQGALWSRASEDDAEIGWPWGYVAEWARTPNGEVRVPTGSVEEGYPVRPLALLVRNGYPAAGR